MSSEVKVPAVGESITTGLLSVWHKKDGDAVSSGEVLFTLETDKVSTEVNATESGTLKIQVPEGEEVKIGQVVATIEAGAAAPAKEEKKPTADDEDSLIHDVPRRNEPQRHRGHRGRTTEKNPE